MKEEAKNSDTVKYEDAMREIERIVSSMENDEPDIDSLAQQLRRAQSLIRLCRDKLTKTDEEIKQLLSEER